MTDDKKDETPAAPVDDSLNESKDPAPVVDAPDTTKAAEPVEFNPYEVEESEDDGTTREEGLNGPDEVEPK